MDNMRSAKERGVVAPEEEVPRRTAPKERKKKRKRDSDDDDYDDDEDDLDYNPSLEEKRTVHRFKRPKLQAATKFVSLVASQVNTYVRRTSLDAGIPGVSLSSQSAEQNRANESMGLHAITSNKGQLPMVSPIPQPYRGDRFDFRYFTSPFVTTSSGPMLRDIMNIPTADACREERLRNSSSTGPPNTECKRQEKQKFISSSADVFREYSLRSNSPIGPPTTECKRKRKQKKFVSFNADGCRKYSLRSSSSSDTNCKSEE